MNIIDSFISNQEINELFRVKLESLIKELLVDENLIPHQTTSRLKSIESLKKKIESKHGKYGDISEVTDCVGLRIITYLEDEVDLVAKIIEEEFILDPENSIDKRKLETDRFGYKSLHHVVSLNKSRLKLREYSKFKHCKAEIQVRSILQHSWAEIEHDLGYKSEIAVPDIVRRDFYRVAALLETADIEFVKIKKSLIEYEKRVESEIVLHPDKISLDKTTLISFIERSNENKLISEGITERTGLKVTGSYGEIDYVLETFKKYKIYSIDQLRKLIIEHLDDIIEFQTKIYLDNGGEVSYTGLGKALSVHGLAEMILLEQDDLELLGNEVDTGISYTQGKRVLKQIMQNRNIIQ